VVVMLFRCLLMKNNLVSAYRVALALRWFNVCHCAAATWYLAKLIGLGYILPSTTPAAFALVDLKSAIHQSDKRRQKLHIGISYRRNLS
jgi:hypothetical protein